MLFTGLFVGFLIILFILSYFLIGLLFPDCQLTSKLVGAEKPTNKSNNISINSRTLELLNFVSQTDCIVQVNGKSMQAATKPVFDKEYLVCRKVKYNEFKRGHNVVIKTDNGLKIREFSKILKDDLVETCHRYEDQKTEYNKHKSSKILGHIIYKVGNNLIREVA